MTLLGNVAANDVLICSVLSALTGGELARLEMVSASLLAELTASQHWVKYVLGLSHVCLAGDCLELLERSAGPERSGVKALFCKLASLLAHTDPALPEPSRAPTRVVFGSSSDLQKLERKLEAAEQKARQARRDGLATTEAMIKCFQFNDGSVSSPVSFRLGLTTQIYLLQLGWTTSDDVVLKVALHSESDEIVQSSETQTLLSISISTIGTGPYFASRDTIVMERKASMLALRSKRGEATCKADTRRKTQENSLLIHELEELRIEKKSLQAEVQELELQVRLAEQRAENKEIRKALPGKPGLERSQSNRQVPEAAQGLFAEAPAIHRGPKGSKVSSGPVVKKSAHKSQEELRKAKLSRKVAEQREQQRHQQRVREELVPQELDSLMKRRAEEEHLRSTSSAGGSQASSGPPVGGALSVVRFHQKGSPAGSVDSV
eukprot:s2885_g8.t2